MNTILVFGFEEYYPWGGVNDLLAVIDNSQGGKLDEHGRLRKDILEQVLQESAKARSNQYIQHVHVLYLNPGSKVERVEKWREAPWPIGIAPGVEVPLPAHQVRGLQTNYEPDPHQELDYPILFR